MDKRECGWMGCGSGWCEPVCAGVQHGGTEGKPDRMPPGDDPRAGHEIPSLMGTQKKRFLCRIGFHSLFTDSVGDMVDMGLYKAISWTTYDACNYCDYRKRRY